MPEPIEQTTADTLRRLLTDEKARAAALAQALQSAETELSRINASAGRWQAKYIESGRWKRYSGVALAFFLLGVLVGQLTAA